MPHHGKGKSGGARAILIFKSGDVTLFLYGYSKNERDNITEIEERQLRLFANEFFDLDIVERERRIIEGKLILVESL